MSGFKILKEPEIRIVHDWLRTMGMSVNRLLNREYADGYLIAKLLKKMYPQLVNLHAYQTSYNYDVKATNWRTLNFKVLRRIGLSLSDQEMESLIRGESGSIEQLMWVIMNFSVEGQNFKLRARRRSPLGKKLTKRKSILRKINIDASPQRQHPPKATIIDVKPKVQTSDDSSSQRTSSQESSSLWEVSTHAESSSSPTSSALLMPDGCYSKDLPSEKTLKGCGFSLRDISTIYSGSSQCEDLERNVADTYKTELESARSRVQELEALIKKQDEILEMLRERANVYDIECQEFYDVIAQVKAKSV